MRTGEDNRDLTTLEKKAGQKAAKNVAAALKSVVKPDRDTGAMLRAIKAKPIMKFDGLDNITIQATNITFIRNYGFEKTSTNKAKYTLNPQDYFSRAFSKTKALEVLADEISGLRAEEIIAKIKW